MKFSYVLFAITVVFAFLPGCTKHEDVMQAEPNLEDKRENHDKIEADAKAKLAELKIQKLKEEAEKREKARRYAPEGIGFNLKSISISTADMLANIPAGTELTVSKNADGTLHVQNGELAADVDASLITNDRDLAATLRTAEQNKDNAIARWKTDQAAAARQVQQATLATPTPAPAKLDSSTTQQPGYVNPLDRGGYNVISHKH